MNINYSTTKKFDSLFKKLAKRFRSLPDDLEIAKRNAIELLHSRDIDNESCFKLKGYENQLCEVYKVKKFACKALKGRGVKSGVRLIYAYHPDKRELVFIEIYFKGDQANENLTLIDKYLSFVEQNKNEDVEDT